MRIRNMYLGLVIQLLSCSIHVAKNMAACVVEVHKCADDVAMSCGSCECCGTHEGIAE